MAEPLDSVAKLLEGFCFVTQWNGDLHAFAEIKALQRGLPGEIREREAIVARNPAEIAAQRGDRQIVPDIQRGKLFGKIAAIRIRLRPLRKVIGKTFRQEMVAAQGLKRVVKDGSVGAVLESSEKFGDRAGRLVADAHKEGNSGKVKWWLCCIP